MDITKDTLNRTFRYYPPTPGQPERYLEITNACKAVAELICRCCPESRERSLALTKLQEVRMWSNASIAINEAPKEVVP